MVSQPDDRLVKIFGVLVCLSLLATVSPALKIPNQEEVAGPGIFSLAQKADKTAAANSNRPILFDPVKFECSFSEEITLIPVEITLRADDGSKEEIITENNSPPGFVEDISEEDLAEKPAAKNPAASADIDNPAASLPEAPPPPTAPAVESRPEPVAPAKKPVQLIEPEPIEPPGRAEDRDLKPPLKEDFDGPPVVRRVEKTITAPADERVALKDGSKDEYINIPNDNRLEETGRPEQTDKVDLSGRNGIIDLVPNYDGQGKNIFSNNYLEISYPAPGHRELPPLPLDSTGRR